MSSDVITTFIPKRPPKSEHSAAYKCFHYRWEAAVPHSFTYSDNYIRLVGVVATEDAEYDKNLPNTMIGGRYTIAELAAFLDEGAPIRIENPQDAKEIYEIIERLLEDWSIYVSRGSSFAEIEAPIDGLMRFTRLADEVKVHASRFIKRPQGDGFLQRRLRGLLANGEVGLLQSRRAFRHFKPTEDDKQKQLEKDRESVRAATNRHTKHVDVLLRGRGGDSEWS